MASQPILPSPIFEGSEKRLEVNFHVGKNSPVSGLRSLSRDKINGLLDQVFQRLQITH